MIRIEETEGTCGSEQFAEDVLTGLSAFPKSLPCKYIYDGEGDRLFREITEQPEYYLTRTEYSILLENSGRIAARLGEGPFNMVELGPGDGGKARVLMEEFSERGLEYRFVPIDICESSLEHIIERSEKLFSDVPVDGLVADYHDGLSWLARSSSCRNFVMFLGSNIGNFEPEAAMSFLKNLREALRPGDMVLIGFDMKKDFEVLNRAYNDERGVTDRFHLNLLGRINRELGGRFRMDTFEYSGHYDPSSGAIKSYLVSNTDQTVHVDGLGTSFSFRAWEPVHTESSYKYTPSDIEEMAEGAGFRIVEDYTDPNGFFVDSLWVAQ
ncbi:MAG: L-histidine N(alpha)-methyltransferase [Thermoplasmata archaeon]|nr:MAG: L-histidine N(alpha)-methyltransferase [Thermoplasmata archaeon]